MHKAGIQQSTDLPHRESDRQGHREGSTWLLPPQWDPDALGCEGLGGLWFMMCDKNSL